MFAPAYIRTQLILQQPQVDVDRVSLYFCPVDGARESYAPHQLSAW